MIKSEAERQAAARAEPEKRVAMKLFGRKERTETGVRRTRDTWFGRITQMFSGPSITDEKWEELEEVLISSDVGVSTAMALVQRTRERVQEQSRSDREHSALDLVKEELLALLGEASDKAARLLENGASRLKPVVVLVVGVNGSGKTTSIAKLTRMFQEGGARVILGAGDTFRAGAIEQLKTWAERLGVEVVANQPGGDSAAVAYDTLQAATARSSDVAIIDTAGRLHTNRNLMEELSKIRRVLERIDPEAPHMTLLVLDATTGQNGLAQAKAFTEVVACDGVFLAKLDGTAKGGMVFSIQKELGLPVLFIGTGETADDLSLFEPRQFVDALLGPADV